MLSKPIRVGGIVGENSFKFFIQFLVYAAGFCAFVLTCIAVFVAERRREVMLYFFF